MTVTNSPSTLSGSDVLEAAASAGSPPGAKSVTTALLDAERQTKQQRQQLAAEGLLGTWRLRFTAPKKPAYKSGQPQGSGFYWPGLTSATLSFGRDAEAADQLTIQNQLQLGPLKLRFTGPAKFLPKKNLLAFDFVRLQLCLGSLTVLNLPIRGKAANSQDFLTTSVGRLPFFAFFAAQPDYMAARGRGGGLALWVKAN